jgi:hypothetical protein
VAFLLPFLFDAGTFAIAAVLIFFLSGSFGVNRDGDKVDWWDETNEGFVWL